MRIDKLVMHADDVKAGSGAEFYGTPILEASNLDVDVREEKDAQFIVRMGLGIKSIPAELLPGEVITDNIIRRSTAAEVVGEAFYKQDTLLENGRKVSVEEGNAGVLVTWRPNGENFAFIHEEVAE